VSHIATVKHRFLNLQALGLAAARCGLELVQGERTFQWFHNRNHPQSKCDHVLRVVGNPNAWEIGVKEKTGDAGVEYELMFDAYAGGHGLIQHTQNQHGPLNRLVTFYEEEAAMAQYTAAGWLVERHEHADGTVELVGCR